MRMPELAAAALAAGVLTLAAAAGLTVPAAAAATGTATLTVVHGIPDTPVDVYANGKEILPDFTFKTVTKPLVLPAGSYTIDVRKAGAAAGSTPVLTATEQVPTGANVTIVAGLTAAGKPALTPFVNDTSAAGAGEGRLVVRHTAAAPAVDVYAASTKVISGLTNGQQQALTVPAGTVPARVTLAGQSAAVIGPVNVPVTAGMATRDVLVEDGRGGEPGLEVGACGLYDVAVGMAAGGDDDRCAGPDVLEPEQGAGPADRGVDVAGQDGRARRLSGRASAGPPADDRRIGRDAEPCVCGHAD